MTESNAQHQQKSDRWFTPVEIVEAARLVLGGIDLDPASEAEANLVVQASRYLTAEDDARTCAWANDIGTPQRIFLNPPGMRDPTTKVTMAHTFWYRLMQERDAGRLHSAIVVAFSLEQLQSSQIRSPKPMTMFPLCIPEKRLKFNLPTAQGKAGSPTHANAIIYVPGMVNETALFAQTFSKIGSIMVPMLSEETKVIDVLENASRVMRNVNHRAEAATQRVFDEKQR